MRILVYIEQAGGELGGSSLELLTKARSLADATSGVVEVLSIGSTALSSEKIKGADVLLQAVDPALEAYIPSTHAAIIESVVSSRNPDLVLFGYTAAGLDQAPYLAARRNLSTAAYCTDLEMVDASLTARCQIYGGKLIATVALETPAVVALTPGSVQEEALAGRDVEVVELDISAALATPSITFVDQTPVDPDAIDITQSERLVCVGRGIGDKENIDEVRALATILKGEVVGSRPIVDLGWLPKERQVGKSGRKVKPRVYLALGVSGAPEHLEGMAKSDLIVAINTDANAPIFRFAHYGATVDCVDFVPALQSAIEKRGA
ncbi:electron transfer flavoprotein subunit alpha/FixB family protein [Sphingomonas abietis]|uniref:Electron transfer flavoprotein subunit alpha/FixB family protein n=1 Tax=Sphingomonas abietis TaxID=3012344 RepID=A0ABY7NKA3_9SPHN|nr:electron transfer flavoprotein subunit alpha/FixB family protein [Sphingomonas abietis]WBO21972.1 electron transfer flavoprotein subunit alpha/FixB family protein [Sphingomonas abietis]